jgi:hypothetical protein
MAELQPLTNTTQTTTYAPVSAPAPPAAVPQIGGPGPLWRSLLFPRRGQRALEFSSDGSTLFASLRQAGVGVERGGDPGAPATPADFDLVLEDRTNGRPPARPESVGTLLAPGGRWVVVFEKKRWVGLAGRRFLRRARLEGFEAIESFYVHPSLRSPRILVPLDRPEPFMYFLSLAVGVRGPRQRLLELGARCLCALRLHRIFLPNLIVVARRTR